VDGTAVMFLSSSLVWVVGIVTVGGTFLLRPLVKQLGEYLESLTEEMHIRSSALDQERTLILLEQIDVRVSRLEEMGDLQVEPKISEGASAPSLGA